MLIISVSNINKPLYKRDGFMKTLKIIIFFSITVLVSCASQETVKEKIAEMEVGPSEAPRRTITNFSSSLRCMDNTLIEYGIKDISIIVEDLEDKTSKVKAGTKDMLITAVSTMTRRSRAVKLIAYGNDSGNVIGFLGNAGSQSVYNIIPQYDIRGSISQLDKSVVSQQSGVSLAGSKWGVGGSKSVNGSILGIDLSVLSTQDLSVIPGVTSSNSVVLFKSGTGADADATIKKVGISFDFTVSKSEATIQALRNLIELASIELIGKLVKVPYWKCLGIPETSIEIKQEVEDWYYSMSVHGEIVPYMRALLIARNYYPSIVMDEDAALMNALSKFRRAVDLPPSNVIDFDVFNSLINDKKTMTAVTVPTQDSSRSQASNARLPDNKSTDPLSIEIASFSGQQSFNPGEAISLRAQSNESAYLYCYLVDYKNEVQRFFPNRFQKQNYLQAGTALELPGKMPFDIVADESGNREYVNCFATRKDSYKVLPGRIKVIDFEVMPGVTISDVRAAYKSVSKGDDVAEAQFVLGNK